MKKTVFIIALISIVTFGFSHRNLKIDANNLKGLSVKSTLQQKDVRAKQKIQVALILDTSNSMDGLIDQAKTELWNIVNELAKAEKDSSEIEVKIALYEYGNSSLSKQSGYIKQVLPFGTDLDEISDKLFKLKTNGGEEYCGKAIKEAINKLEWEDSKEALKIIYIAGNEPFNQGPVSYSKSCKSAAKKDIYINTIHCGDEQVGINGGWELGATYGTGHYFAIDQDVKTYLVATPYDDQINLLNEKLNSTYVPYGKTGVKYYERQRTQDLNALSYSKQNNAKRAISKSSGLYSNHTWDLVDAYTNDSKTIVKIDQKSLSVELQQKSFEELEAYVLLMKKRRDDIKKQIQELAILREAYIISQKKEKSNSLGNSIIAALHKQAAKKNFTFKSTF